MQGIQAYTTEQRIDIFLGTSSLNERRPTAYMRELDSLLVGLSLNDIKHRVFMRSLQPRIESAISVNMTNSLDDLAKAAYRFLAQSVNMATVSGIADVILARQLSMRAWHPATWINRVRTQSASITLPMDRPQGNASRGGQPEQLKRNQMLSSRFFQLRRQRAQEVDHVSKNL